MRVAVDEREVDALRRPFGELLDERAAGPRRQREQHHARGVAIDAVDDERLAPAVRAVALLEEIEHRRAVRTWRVTGAASSSGTVSIPAGLLTTISVSSSNSVSRP